MSSKNHSADAHHGPTVSIYWLIFACLLALTALTVAVAKVQFLRLPTVGAIVIAFMIAISKATLVVTFFMHVKYDSKVLRILCVMPTLLTLVLLLALLPDIASHGKQVAGDPALHVAVVEPAAEAGHEAEAHPAEEH